MGHSPSTMRVENERRRRGRRTLQTAHSAVISGARLAPSAPIPSDRMPGTASSPAAAGRTARRSAGNLSGHTRPSERLWPPMREGPRLAMEARASHRSDDIGARWPTPVRPPAPRCARNRMLARAEVVVSRQVGCVATTARPAASGTLLLGLTSTKAWAVPSPVRPGSLRRSPCAKTLRCFRGRPVPDPSRHAGWP